MKSTGVARIGLGLAVLALGWIYRLPVPGDLRAFLALGLCILVGGVAFELVRSSPTSTMGPRSDGLIGFEAQVGAIEPLQVQAHGAVWQARLIGGGSVQVGVRVRVVDREGVTLLVEASGFNQETA